MNRSLIAILITSGFTVQAHDIITEKTIPATGVIAHTVLSQVEIAKVKSFELNKAISLEKERSRIKLTLEKLSFVNDATEEGIQRAKEEDVPTRKKMDIAITDSNILSESFLWADGILEESKKSPYAQYLKHEISNLNTQIIRARAFRNELESLLSFYQMTLSKDQERAREIQKVETKRLLEAKDDELKAMIENKLLIGIFEYNAYYMTSESSPQKDEIELLKKVFSSISDMDHIAIEIIGRADPRGERKYNENLAKTRAEKIKEIAISSGIEANKIKVSSYVSDVRIKKNRELHFFDRNTTITIQKRNP
ncbi:OmpA family protein [Photobacterium galatheae]|uniref:OmpA-like domain-containing protein n=1 Tax=Photobacterium galatheae TaxID=1654360 RepID=A0A066RKD7_9GAMM|nr:OmpA family protein [Photobacterium galatheae]KDM90915.1 hypothetical protein EA58_14240 [Photobacterium galatheae]MCM0149121.1 OmpA family protein [Photobacterium galatheae]